METQITFKRNAAYLRVTVTGSWPSKTYREILTSIRDEAVKSGHTRVLIDARGLPAPAGDMDRFGIGVAIAELFEHRIKIAILAPQAYINKLLENAAVNRGADVLGISDEDAALQWLVGKQG